MSNEILRLSNQIILAPLKVEYAREVFDLIDRNRPFFSQYGEEIALNHQTIESVTEPMDAYPDRQFFVIQNNQKQIIGGITLSPTDGNPKKGNIGYFLGPEFNGNGYMTQAVNMLTQKAFTEMNFTQLCGGVHEDNLKSIHVLQRAGYKKTNYYIKDNHQNIMFIREKPRLFHF